VVLPFNSDDVVFPWLIYSTIRWSMQVVINGAMEAEAIKRRLQIGHVINFTNEIAVTI
jgi:hypothetical protein